MRYNNYYISMVPVTVTCSKSFNCNTITFVNKGLFNVTINGVLTLTPGESFNVQGYPGEMCVQAFDIVFPNRADNGNNLICILKEYKDQT